MPENNQVFEVAENRELVDENGVNETLLEGYFIMHSIDDSDESHDTFIEAWEELYCIDEERWDGPLGLILHLQMKNSRTFLNSTLATMNQMTPSL